MTTQPTYIFKIVISFAAWVLNFCAVFLCIIALTFLGEWGFGNNFSLIAAILAFFAFRKAGKLIRKLVREYTYGKVCLFLIIFFTFCFSLVLPIIEILIPSAEWWLSSILLSSVFGSLITFIILLIFTIADWIKKMA